MSSSIDETCEELIQQIEQSGTAFVESLRTTAKEPITFDNLIICGMGGSGISADYVSKFAEESSTKRVIVSKNYTIPNFVDENWGAVVISYSGNTEETLTSFKILLEKGINPVCITSNGKLKKFAKENNLQYVEVPTGIAPRAAFPYLFGSLYGLVAESLSLPIPDPEEEERLKQTSIIENKDNLDTLITKLVGTIPIILYPGQLSNVGLRFRCQLNENSKMTAANFELPEFSHNGIVGFDAGDNSTIALMLLRTDAENTRASIHLDFYRDHIEDLALIHEFHVHGSSLIEKHLQLTWLLDYISVKLAQIQHVDPLGVHSIDKLKALLKKK